MRKLFLDKSAIIVKEVAQPLLDDCSVLVRVYYSFISSGTQLEMLTRQQAELFNNVPYKIKKILDSVGKQGIDKTTSSITGALQCEVSSIGYSCSGRVIATGKRVKKLTIGDWVACAGARYAHHADLISVPEHLAVRVSSQEWVKAASITTIGSIALQGVRQARLELGGIVAVVGLGLLGQLTVQLAKLSGCYVIGIDLLADRLEVAKKLGADAVYQVAHDINNIDTAEPNKSHIPMSSAYVAQEIVMLTQQHGVDFTIITASCQDSTPIHMAMDITRKKGRIVIVGDVELNFPRDEFYKKELDVVMSCSYGPGRYDVEYEEFGRDYPYAYVRWTENRNMQACVNLIEQGKLIVDPLICAEVELSDIAYAYTTIYEKKALGVVLKYMGSNEIDEIEKSFFSAQKLPAKSLDEVTYNATFIYPTAHKLRVALVGAGSFAKETLLPIISHIKNTQIDFVIDTYRADSSHGSRLYRGAYALAYDDDIFIEDNVDVIVIVSPTKVHYTQALKALEHGKAIFIEQPIIRDFEQLAQLRQLLDTNKITPLCIDYGRSFAPFIQKIKILTQNRQAPLMIQYRMNAHKNNWKQPNTGSGNIIGHASQIFDLFCYLTDAKPIVVSVEALHASRDDIFPTDNFSVQISFDDGSLCSLLYTSRGHTDLGSERMELFFDGKSVVMDDYTRLFGFGVPSWFNETVSVQDRGHQSLITKFFSELKQKKFSSPINVARVCMVAELALHIDQLICEGGGTQKITM